MKASYEPNGGVVSRRKRRVIMVALATLLGVLGTTVLASPAQASTGRFINWGNGKCIEAGVDQARLGEVYLWECNGLPQQQWVRLVVPGNDGTACCFEYRNVLFGSCLNVASGGALAVDLQPCHRDIGLDVPGQRWRVWYAFNQSPIGWYHQLQNAGDGTCLHIVGNESANGATISMSPCDPFHGHAQRWMWL
jgi:hypothetical protein